MNSLKSIVVAMVAGATFAVSIPAMAQSGDGVNIIRNDQNSVVTGSGNTVRNNSTQTSTSVRNGRRTGGDQGNVLENRQNADVYGNDNKVENTSKQNTTDVRNNGRVLIRR